MTLLTWMQPPDHRAAGRAVSILTAVSATVTLVFATFQTGVERPGSIGLLVAGSIIALVVLLGVLARYFKEANTLAWALCPLLAIAALVVVDLLTHDSSVAAQIFFLFPALYGASQLRPPG